MIGVGISFLMLGFLEGFFFFLNFFGPDKPITQHEGTYTTRYFQDDEWLGYKPIPDVQASSTLNIDGETVYNITYSIDEYSRRITPVNHHESRQKFAVFFGGSFTLGQGVQDNETLPFYFAEFAPQYMPYNYGFHGYGPQQMLAKLQQHDLRKDVEESEGLFIYTYIPGHEARAIGDMYVYNGWGRNMPFYTIDSRNKLVRKGNFTSGRPFRSFLYTWLGKSQLVKYFQLNIPPKLHEKHYRLTVRIIKEAQLLCKEKFPQSSFYVIIYPNANPQQKIIPYLQEAEILSVDYSRLFDPLLPEYHIEGDGHPSSKAYETVAKALITDLSLLLK